jgi:protein ImuA
MVDRNRLDDLRTRVRTLEQGGAAERPVLPTGVAEIDAVLPGGGLAVGRVHQITGGEDGFAGPATAFTAVLAARLSSRDDGHTASGTVLWIVQRSTADDTLYAPSLASFGLPPERLVVARARDEAEVLWTMEESLRCAALSVVTAQVRRVDLTAGRRLQLAAEQSGVTGFLLPSLHGAGWQAPGKTSAAAATTRWQVESAPGEHLSSTLASDILASNILGPVRWTVTLERCQGGIPRAWLVEWNDATRNLAVVSALPDRPPDEAGDAVRLLE